MWEPTESACKTLFGTVHQNGHTPHTSVEGWVNGDLLRKLALCCTIPIEEISRRAACCIAAVQIATPHHYDFLALQYVCVQL